MEKVFNKIVCQVDIDDSSTSGLELAHDLAEVHDGIVYLFHVVPLIATVEMRIPAAYYRAMENEARGRLQEIADRYLKGRVRHEVLLRATSRRKKFSGKLKGLAQIP